MASVDDVAAGVLRRTGPIDTFKFQKLVYYCQAWHLVWEGRKLFQARIEAWANGPVVPHLYRLHRREYRIRQWPDGHASNLTHDERTTLDGVIDYYGSKSGQELATLTHRERPWREARERAHLAPGERGNVEITPESMLEYYGSLV